MGRKKTGSELIVSALCGNLDVDYPSCAKTIRIYVCSGLKDTEYEKNLLIEHVYPELRKSCERKGYQFQVVDVRWGVEDEATDKHNAQELYLEEIKECQLKSVGPNFIILLGQKYGYRPFPTRIPSVQFDELLAATPDTTDKALLKLWFHLDDNCVPMPQYTLVPVTENYPNFVESENEEQRKEERIDWLSDFENLQTILRKAAKEVFDYDDDDRHSYFRSMLEQEITMGLDIDEPQAHCHCFLRTIADLREHSEEEKALDYIDISNGKVDNEAQGLLTGLIEDVIPKTLPKSSITSYKIEWNKNGIDPDDSKDHKKYIEKFQEDFKEAVGDMISTGISDQEDIADLKPTHVDIIQHLNIARKHISGFLGREKLLDRIQEHLKTGERNYPLVIHGAPGSGKTALMAKIVELLPSWFRGSDQVIIAARFIGATSSSTNLRQLLLSLCLQLAEILDEEVPWNLDKLTCHEIKKEFKVLLKAVKLRKRVFLLLDSVDQLHDQEMDWLPLLLPSDTFAVILSTSDGEDAKVLTYLKKSMKERFFLDIKTLDDDDINIIMKESLKTKERILTNEQTKVVREAAKACPLPLYLKLILNEATRWRSDDPPEVTTLKGSVPEIIHDLFERLEKAHGQKLVSHALGYITGTRSGISESELEDLLSCDDLVLNDVFKYHTPSIRRFPFVVWLRIKFDIQDYLTDRGADGIEVVNWCHQQFREVATDRYLSAKEPRIALYKCLVEFFQGRWADGVEKPYLDKNWHPEEVNRHVKSQRLLYKEGSTLEEAVYNLRKMSELPYALCMSEQEDALKKNIVCNLNWSYQKAKAVGVESILDDFAMIADSPLSADPDINMITKVIQQSHDALLHDISELPLQLTARILSVCGELSPAVKNLLKQAQNPPFPCLLAKQAFLTPRKKGDGDEDSSNVELDGHENPIKLTVLSTNKSRVVTLAEDKIIKIWDAASGSEFDNVDLNDFKGSGDPDALILCHNEDLLISSYQEQIEFYNTRTREILEKKITMLREDLLRKVPILYYEEKNWLLALTDLKLLIWKIELENFDEIGDFDVGKAASARHHQAKDFFEIRGSKVGLMRASTNTMMIFDVETFAEKQEFIGTFNVDFDPEKNLLTRCALLPADKLACIVYEADHKEGKDHSPAVLFTFTLDGQQLAKFSVFSVDFALGKNDEPQGYECLMPVEEEDHVLFLNYDCSYGGSIIYDIDLTNGSYNNKYQQRGTITQVNYIGDNRATILNDDAKNVVEICELVIEDPHKGLSTDAQLTSTYREEVQNILILPSTSRYVAASHRVSQLVIWDLAAMKEVRVLNTENVSIDTSLMQFPTASLGVSVTGTKQLVAFDMKSFQQFGPHEPAFGGHPQTLSFDVVNSTRAIGPSKDERSLEIKDFKTGKTVTTLKCLSEEQVKEQEEQREETREVIKHVIVSGNGAVVIAFTNKPTYAIVWDIKSKKERRLPDLSYENLKFEVLGKKGVAISHNGRYVVAIEKVKTRNFVMWDLEAGTGEDPKECKKPTGRRGNACSLGISRKLQSVIVGYTTGFLGIYNMKNLMSDAFFKVSTNKMGIWKLVLSEDGSLAACSGHHNGVVVVVDLIKEVCLSSVTIESHAWDYQFTRDNQFLMLGGGNIKGVIQLYIHRGRNAKLKGNAPFDKTLEMLRKKDAFYGDLKSLELSG